jgi:hypothetical protein
MLPKRFLRILICTLAALSPLALTYFSRPMISAINSDLTVHEWGTFTSIAGHEGRAVSWQPLAGKTDLPNFVEHLRDENFKGTLSGTVRMETPVLYFYAPRAMTLSVKVSFARGVITEWYPHANRVEPTAYLKDAVLYTNNAGDGSIAWDSVAVDPSFKADFPVEKDDRHYYAARKTSATLLRVKSSTGDQQEKFLFYRGVSVFPTPISATLTPDGNKLLVRNLGAQEIPNIIRFERRGKKLGYSVGGVVRNKVTLDAPKLTAELDSLDKDLENMLVAQGLYADEARAMVQTWRDSWFEEGSRVIYIVPAGFADKILPLSIHPAPAQTLRVFVGRLELITPATEQAVQTAFESRDELTLRKYGRFLEPILTEMMQNASDKDRRKTLTAYLNSANRYAAQN